MLIESTPTQAPVVRSRFGRVIKAPERYSPELSSGEEFEDDYTDADESGSDDESTTGPETSNNDPDDDPDYVEGMETEEGDEVISDGDEESDAIINKQSISNKELA